MASAADGVRPKESAIRFSNDVDEAIQRAREAGRPVFLEFFAVWCPVCRRMDSVTLLDPAVQEFADDFVWVKIDIDRNLSLAREWQVEATPTIFLLDEEGLPQSTIVGGADAGQMAGMLGDFLIWYRSRSDDHVPP